MLRGLPVEPRHALAAPAPPGRLALRIAQDPLRPQPEALRRCRLARRRGTDAPCELLYTEVIIAGQQLGPGLHGRARPQGEAHAAEALHVTTHGHMLVQQVQQRLLHPGVLGVQERWRAPVGIGQHPAFAGDRVDRRLPGDDLLWGAHPLGQGGQPPDGVCGNEGHPALGAAQSDQARVLRWVVAPPRVPRALRHGAVVDGPVVPDSGIHQEVLAGPGQIVHGPPEGLVPRRIVRARPAEGLAQHRVFPVQPCAAVARRCKSGRRAGRAIPPIGLLQF